MEGANGYKSRRRIQPQASVDEKQEKHLHAIVLKPPWYLKKFPKVHQKSASSYGEQG